MVLSQRFVGCVGCKERGLRDLRLRHFDNPRLRNGAASVEALLYLYCKLHLFRDVRVTKTARILFHIFNTEHLN